MMKTNTLKILPAIGLAIFAANTQGQTQANDDEFIDPYKDWYQVEIIIFKNLDKDARLEELWPTEKNLTLSENTQSLNELLSIPVPSAIQASIDAGELAAQLLEEELLTQEIALLGERDISEDDVIDATILMPPENQLSTNDVSNEDLAESELNQEQLNEPILPKLIPATRAQFVLSHQALQIKYSRQLQVLYHGAWQQAFSEDLPATNYRLSIEHDGNQIDGTINMLRKRFVHVQTDLWMHELPTTQIPIASEVATSQPRIDNTEAVQNTLAIETNDTEAAPPVIEYARLYKKERLRRNELHYIDHPLMGMLIQITPYNEVLPQE